MLPLKNDLIPFFVINIGHLRRIKTKNKQKNEHLRKVHDLITNSEHKIGLHLT